MKRWQRVALMLLPVLLFALGALYVLQLGETARERDRNAGLTEELAAVNARLDEVSERLDAVTDALLLANASIAALGGEQVPVPDSGNTETTSPQTTSPTNPPATTPTTRCTVNLAGVCI